MNFRNITTIQWFGIIILFNTTLLGGSSQLGDLMLSAIVVKAILALATLGNGFLGGLVTMFGGQGTQMDNVASIQGKDGRPALRINVNDNATPLVAAKAVDPTQPNIGAATPEARTVLLETVNTSKGVG